MSDVAILHDLEARLALTAGVDIVANAVKCTMGPQGRNVAYRGELGPPKITHDGVSVARDIRLRNGFLQTGAAIVTEACRLTNAAAGDGTTTAAVLTQALTHEAQRLVAAGADPMRLRRGLAAAVLQVDRVVREQAQPITTLRETAWVAGLAAHDADLGEIIAGIFHRYGPGAAVTVELGQGLSTEARTVEGMRLERGLASRQLATAGAGLRAELEDCDVLVTDRELGGVGPLLPFLDAYVAGGGQRLLVVAKTVGGETLATLVENHRLGRMTVIAVRAPVFGERQRAILEDLAIFTGATLVAHESGDPWGSVPVSVLGRAARVRSDTTETLVLGGGGEPQAVADRVELLWLYRDRAKNQFDREKLEERIRNLSGAVSEVHVAAPTDAERQEARQRVEDAVAATRAALEEGIVAGGGAALARAARDLTAPPDAHSDEADGWRVVRRALAAPVATIAHNAGFEGAVVADAVATADPPRAFDVTTGEYVDPLAAGIVDPVAVVRAALRYAASAAVMIVTSNAVVADAASYGPWVRGLRRRIARDAGILLAG